MKRRIPSLLLGLITALVVGNSGLAAGTQMAPSTPTALGPTSTKTPANFAAATPSNPISLEYTFSTPVVEHLGEYDRVTVPGLHTHGEPGMPVLPFKTARILLPGGAELGEIEVVPGTKGVLEGSHYVEPGQTLVPAGSAPENTRTPPDPTIYHSLTQFPGKLYSLVSVQKLTGYTILLLNLYPIQYTPQTGELTYYTSLTVSVKTTPSARLTAASPSMLRAVPKDADRVQGMVDNPQTLETYLTGDSPATHPAKPQASIVDVGDPYDYVIITSQALSSTFQALVDWKVSKGLTARTFTTEDIYANYTGNDDPERIRNFIVDAYTTWAATDHPLQYVMLGGDTEVIPIRSIYIQYSSYSTYMPVDLYYAGLDSNWDADGDGNYGEPAGAGTEGEEVDFFAKVYVGRMPVETSTEATYAISKTIAYEQNPTTDYLDRALWLGNQLDDHTWGGDSKDLISNLVPQYNVTALYSRDGTYSTSGVINNMNAGVHLVNFDGHGNSNCCPLNNSQVSALTNDDPFFFYNLGCNTAHFDQSSDEAVAEYYVFTEHGAFAYVGNTRYGWYSPGSTNGPGNQLDQRFFDFAVNTDDHNVGKALQLAKEDYYPGHRWSILTLSLFGDPETPLVTELPVPVANISAPKGGSTIKYSVDVVGTATAGYAPGVTFSHYLVEYGSGINPGSWTQVGVTSTTPMTDSTLATWDTTTLLDGTYTVRLTVDDGAGETSVDRAIVKTDNFYITAPPEGQLVRGGDVLTITGSALGSDFENCVLEYGQGSSPSSWTFIFSSTVPVTDGVLLAWDTSPISEADNYTIRLTRNGSAHTSSERVTVYIDPTWLAGWPQLMNYRIVAPSMAVGDVDGDGDLELVATSSNGSYSSYIHIWHHDGTPVTGWPRWLSGKWVSAPALADIDRDGDLEIIVGTWNSSGGQVSAWHHDGTPVVGWPQQTNEVYASPAVADLDGDGSLEIMVGSFDGNAYVWHYDGTLLPGWPQATGDKIYASPALGDLDGDGDVEIVTARRGAVYAWHHDGTTVAGWPVTVTQRTHSSPALGDITGDGGVDVVIGAGDEDERLYAWQRDGTVVPGWPLWVPAFQESGDRFNRLASPLLTDLDQDGDVEVAIGAESYVIIHDLPGAYDSANIEWPSFQYDQQLTGWYAANFPNMPPSSRTCGQTPGTWPPAAW